MRPYSKGGSDSAIQSPICADGFFFCASASVIWVASFSTSSTTSKRREKRISPVFGLISARTSVSWPYRERAAFCIASSIEASTIERSIDFSRATASTICNSSSRLALTAIFVSLHGPGRRESAGFGRILSVPRAPRPRFARLPLRGLLAPQRGADEIVGQHEPRLAHRGKRKRDPGLGLVVGDDAERGRGSLGTFGQRFDAAAKPLAAVDRRGQLELRLVPDGPAEIRLADERAVDPRRRHFEPVGPRHDVPGVEH